MLVLINQKVLNETYYVHKGGATKFLCTTCIACVNEKVICHADMNENQHMDNLPIVNFEVLFCDI